MLPAMMVGPTLVSNIREKSSLAFVGSMLEGRMKGLPHIQVHLVDVRDVAQAHINAIEIPEAANRRYILHAESMWFKTMA